MWLGHNPPDPNPNPNNNADCPVVQLLYFPMPIREGVGIETLDGSISVEGYSLDSTRSHHHQSSVQQPQHRHTKEQLQKNS